MTADIKVFVEDWAPEYGSPYLIAGETDLQAELQEDGDRLEFRPGNPIADRRPVAFIDGVRRSEATMSASTGGTFCRGLAGAHASGAVVCHPDNPPRFDRCTAYRLIIWGSGFSATLPPVGGGWSWSTSSIASDEPDAPLAELQIRMREAEGELAEDLCEQGLLTVVDGPLNFVRSRDLPVAGFVKTHHRPLLAPEHHARIPLLPARHRTSLFRKRDDIYSAYLRLIEPAGTAGPWAGIIRIELPASAGLEACIETADELTAALPRFAGVPHADPRAPQNLQPIGALERHLRHLLGDPGLAARAVREAVRQFDVTGSAA